MRWRDGDRIRNKGTPYKGNLDYLTVDTIQLTLYGGLLIPAPPTTGLISHFIIEIGLKLCQGHLAILVAVVQGVRPASQCLQEMPGEKPILGIFISTSELIPQGCHYYRHTPCRLGTCRMSLEGQIHDLCPY